MKSGCWTVVVPLPVIVVLDSQSSNMSRLGNAATAALRYITSHVKFHAISLKDHTSRGNYLSNLNVQTGQGDFTSNIWEYNMDDLILRAAIWQG